LKRGTEEKDSQMTISKSIWRFQCDPNGEEDPLVEVFMQRTMTVDGESVTEKSMTPVPMRFSELFGLLDLTNVEKIDAKRVEIKEANERRIAEAEAATAKFEAQSNKDEPVSFKAEGVNI